MYGVGAAHKEHWIVSAGFKTAFIAFRIGSGDAIAITYAIDCYPEIASDSLVLMIFVRTHQTQLEGVERRDTKHTPYCQHQSEYRALPRGIRDWQSGI